MVFPSHGKHSWASFCSMYTLPRETNKQTKSKKKNSLYSVLSLLTFVSNSKVRRGPGGHSSDPLPALSPPIPRILPVAVLSVCCVVMLEAWPVLPPAHPHTAFLRSLISLSLILPEQWCLNHVKTLSLPPLPYFFPVDPLCLFHYIPIVTPAKRHFHF